VNAGVKPDMDDAASAAARRKATAEIEKASTEKSGLRSDVVTLYQGGRYHLYTYKKYTDVRLVFAPEFDIAFFGGDPDNFEFPRYCLDICFFRAYEDGKPARIAQYLKWSPNGSKEGDLVFVAGHPGRTDRLNTMAGLEYLRDVALPALREGASAAGRTAPPLIAHAWVALGMDRDAAHEVARKMLPGYARQPFYANMWAAAGFTCIGRVRAPCSSFASASASASGSCVVFAPVLSASYSRVREIESWMIEAAIGINTMVRVEN
jgi:hypothetical protein